MAGCAKPHSRCRKAGRSEEHTSELQSLRHLVCRLLLEKKKPLPTLTASTRRNTHQTQHTQPQLLPLRLIQRHHPPRSSVLQTSRVHTHDTEFYHSHTTH